jgi:hypothetical protein
MVVTMVHSAFAASAPVPGNPNWDAKYAKAPKLNACESARKNANGDKITSNAHAADFPGMYFYWNDKQKDDGVLLVNPDVFDLFANSRFILTAKNSNAYWDYIIAPSKEHLIDGVYAYGIPRNFKYADKKGKQVSEELKNINMVFIEGDYKSAQVELSKLWENKDGGFAADKELTAQVIFTGLKLGKNEFKFANFSEAMKGKKITVSEAFNNDSFEFVYSKVDGVNVAATRRVVLLNGAYKTVYEISFNITAKKSHTVEFGNRNPVDDDVGFSGDLVGFIVSNEDPSVFNKTNFAPIPFGDDGVVNFNKVYELYEKADAYWTSDTMKGATSETIGLDANPIPVNPDTVLSWCISGDVNEIIQGAFPIININNLVHKNGPENKVTYITLFPWGMAEPKPPLALTVTYNPNGGEGSVIVDDVNEGDEYTIRKNPDYYKSGYGFNEWNTEPDGSGDYYFSDDIVNITESLILYVMWERIV